MIKPFLLRVFYTVTTLFIVCGSTLASFSQETSTKASAEVHLACSWMSSAYGVPEQVPYTLVQNNYSWTDILLSLHLMSETGSLNRVLQMRRQLNPRSDWTQIFHYFGVDLSQQPQPVQTLAQNSILYHPKVEEVIFTPDVSANILAATAPTRPGILLPSRRVFDQFKLPSDERELVQNVLLEPMKYEPQVFQKYAGKNRLVVGDWVIASVASQSSLLPLETLLSARQDQMLSWPEIFTALQVNPEVLAIGPLSYVYPYTQSPQDWLTWTFRPVDYPESLSSQYRFSKLTSAEHKAFLALHWFNSQMTPEDWSQLIQYSSDPAEVGVLIELFKLNNGDLEEILRRRKLSSSLASFLKHNQNTNWDLTNHPALRHYLGTHSTP